MRLIRTCLMLCLVLLLGACGFHLRGSFDIPYEGLYIDLPENSVLGADLRRQINAHQPHLLVEDRKKAKTFFRQLGSDRERIIAAINAEGRAREYQLRLRYSFNVIDDKGQSLIPPNQIILAREVTYDDNQVLAKDQEENFLWQDMERDLAQQILRRLSVVQPKPKAPAEPDDN